MKIGYIGYLWRYLFYVVMIGVAIFAVLWLLENFAPDLYNSLANGGGLTGLNAVSAILPGLYLGQKFYRTEQRKMTGSEAWGLAALCSVAVVVLSFAVIYALTTADPQLAQELDVVLEDPNILLIVVGVMTLILILVTRLMFWSAMRGEEKSAERRARKAAK